MTLGTVLIPIISAIFGWFALWMTVNMLFHPRKPKKIIGITLQGIFPKHQQLLGAQLGKLVSEELFSLQDISAKFTNPENVNKLMPLVEEHIDYFLRVKLAEKMPVISMFIGDKTIGELKTVFLEELQTLFPTLMQNYMTHLQQDLDLEQIVTQKIASFSMDKLEHILNGIMSKEFRFVKIIGAVLGFVIGLLQITFTLLHI